MNNSSSTSASSEIMLFGVRLTSDPILKSVSLSLNHTPSSESQRQGEREKTTNFMAFLSFLGRVLFVSVFILTAWQEYIDFGEDGGVVALDLKPKIDVFSKHVVTRTGFQLPPVERRGEREKTMKFMAFLSFLGRVLFVSVFILTAWQDGRC